MTSVLSFVVLFREGFDVIHSHNPPDIFFLVALPYKLLGKRFVFDHHDLSPEMYFARFQGKASKTVQWVLLLLERWTFRVANHVLSANQSYRLIAIERGKVRGDCVTVLRNGPSLDWLKPVDPDRELRKRGRMLLGYVGMIGFQDGVDNLLYAIKHLVDDLNRKDVYAVIIGRGAAWESLKQLATDLGINDHILWTGLILDKDLIRHYLSTVDICIEPDSYNPYTDRSTTIKMMEYMAMGKPIVAFDLTEHRVTAQDAALYVSGNDVMRFAEKIAELMDNPERRKQMAEFGRQRVEDELAWEHQAQHLLAAYDELTAN
jgi:glycosyltransferase involved in cell wall biosynthesis